MALHTMKHYRLFGFTLASDHPFASPLLPGAGKPDVTFACGDRFPERNEWGLGVPRYMSPYRDATGESTFQLYRGPDYDVLAFSRFAEFFVWGDRVGCRPLDLADDVLIELRLLGPVLAFWMERRGLLTLHAAAVEIDGGAVAFLAGKRGGKTSLAAAFVQSGQPLLGDDLVPLEVEQDTVIVRPAYPQMRMWSSEVEHFLGRADGLARVHPSVDKRRVPVGPNGLGRFGDEPAALRCVYVAERLAGANLTDRARIVPLSPSTAAMALVRHGFVTRLAVAAGMQAQELALAARTADLVSVRHLAYPDGLHHLPGVRQAVIADLAQLGLRPGAA